MLRLLAFLALLLPFASNAQIGMGQWRMHIPASEAIDVAAGNGLVMTALTSGVLEYDIAAGENRILNNLNALSDIDVTCIVYEPQTHSFFIGYENGNIDRYTSSSSIINIPAIKLAAITGSKRINKMIAANGKIYVACGFGVVILDPANSEVDDTWYPTNGLLSVNDLTFRNDSVYVLTDQRLYRGNVNNAFLIDPTQWTIDNRLPVPTGGSYSDIGVKNNEIYFSYLDDANGGDSVFHLTATGIESFIANGFEVKRFEIQDGLFYVYYEDKMVAFNQDLSVNFGVEYHNLVAAPKRVVAYDGLYWVADHKYGLIRFQGPMLFSFIQREGPPKNEFFSLSGAKDKILVTGGSIDRVVFKYSSAGAYTFLDESWTLYDRSNQTNWTDDMWDIGSAAVYSENLDQMALGCYCPEGVALVNGTQVSQVYNPDNSLLEATTLGNGNVCVSNMEYDEEGNLWLLNCYSNKPLKVLLADGTWKAFETGTPTKAKFTSKIVIDGNGNKWFGVYTVGMVGYNDNDTPENPNDDTYKLLTDQQGQGSLPSSNVTAIAVDRDNEIWIGTEAGFAVLYNSEGIFTSSSYDASRILIDFEGNIENLLGDTYITDIEIDGGNRKWIATASSGIFLLSADGQEVLAQYTKENSQLISNNIMDMKFNDISGELFIVTDEGLVSFRTDASEEDLEYATTTVFPNPVKPDYFGPITIQGIRYDSDVKITDAAGNLVYQTTSNGGTATWNGKRLTGEDVASGVYLIWTATNEGKGRKVGKVVVIR